MLRASRIIFDQPVYLREETELSEEPMAPEGGFSRGRCGPQSSSASSGPPRRTRWSSALLSLALVVAVAAGVRAAHHAVLQGGPLLYLHHWTESDMHYFQAWARGFAAGDLLSRESGRPAHSWHDNFAREVHQRSGSTEPYGPEVRRRLWDRWLGGSRFYQDPLYPYALAASFRLFGDSVLPVFLAQALLGIGCAALAWLLARMLFDAPSALASGLLAALFGPLLLHELLLLRESAITFTGLAMLAAGAAALSRQEHRRWPLVTGILAGILVLLKSSALVIFAAFIMLLLHRLRSRPREAVLRAALCLAGFALSLSPLVARNVAVGVPPFAFAASGPVTFINHNFAGYDPMSGDTTSDLASGILHRSDGRFLPSALETIRTHESLGGWLRLVAGKLAAFWQAWEVPNNASYDYYRLSLGALAWILVGFPLVAPLAVVGIALAGFRSHAHALLLAHLGAGLLLTAVFYHLSRFRVPIAVAMIPFAGFALAAGLEAMRARRWKPFAGGLATVVVVAAIVLRPLPQDRPRIRVADYGVANEITGHLAARLEEEGAPEEALSLLDRQLRTEPAELRDLRPIGEETRISVHAALLAGSFRPLHQSAAKLCVQLGRAEEAGEHARAAETLARVEQQVEGAGRPR